MVRGQRCWLFPRSPAEKPTSSENCIQKSYPMFTNPSTSLLRVPGRVSPAEPQTSLGCPLSSHSPLAREEEQHSSSGVCVKDVLALTLTLLLYSFKLQDLHLTSALTSSIFSYLYSRSQVWLLISALYPCTHHLTLIASASCKCLICGGGLVTKSCLTPVTLVCSLPGFPLLHMKFFSSGLNPYFLSEVEVI